VVLFQPDSPQPCEFVRPAKHWHGAAKLAEEEVEVPLPQPIDLTALCQPIARVLRHRLEEPVASRPGGGALDGDERLADQRGE